MALTVIQVLPALEAGGVERGTLEIAAALVKRGHRSIVISAGGRLVKQLTDEDSEHITLPIGKKSLFTLRYVRHLREILGKENVSIVHARSRLPAWISYLALRAMDPERRPRFVTTVHGPYSVNPYSRIMTSGERVIAISEFIRDYIINNYPGVDAGKITVIPRGISSKEFPRAYQPPAEWLAGWRQKYPELINKFIITLPARITRWKGQEDFIELVRMALDRNLPVHGLVAGGHFPHKTSFHDELLSMSHKYHINDHITFLGHRDDLKDIMAVSDVVLSLARVPEAFGRTALEALALGIPVIAYNHGGAAEILHAVFPQGLINPLDTTAAADAVEKFYKKKPVVTGHNPYTLERMTQETLRLYETFCIAPRC